MQGKNLRLDLKFNWEKHAACTSENIHIDTMYKIDN